MDGDDSPQPRRLVVAEHELLVAVLRQLLEYSQALSLLSRARGSSGFYSTIPRVLETGPLNVSERYRWAYEGSGAAGLEPRFRLLHHRSPPMSTGASHQPKTTAEMIAVAMTWSTLSEASHARSTTSPGSQVGLGGGGLVTGWMFRVIWE